MPMLLVTHCVICMFSLLVMNIKMFCKPFVLMDYISCEISPAPVTF
uniref:Uncharacterized protein n=1 Tax=Arundo donax TaxID=35708 RepID=A0A0A9GVT2_ARUDO